MTQLIRPDASTTRTQPEGRLVPAIRGQATMHACMNDIAPASTDYIESLAGSSGEVMVVGVGDPTTTPTNDFNHIIRFCASKDASGGANVGLLCQLRQSYVSETDQGTLIAEFTGTEIPNTVDTFFRYRLTTGEASLITDYTALSLRFVVRNLRGGAPRSCRLHWAAIELPTASEPAQHRLLTEAEAARQRRGQAVVQDLDRVTVGDRSRGA